MMVDIWWKAHPHDLHRVADRVSSVYMECCHIDRDENAVLINKRGTVRVPPRWSPSCSSGRHTHHLRRRTTKSAFCELMSFSPLWLG
ncbi:hypothetical protein AB0L65_31990 [Nonomuraea sp. NPDC052116]|uniref:hypothetical protein n=1 Tax=Nonomuraea sp. NPDC052116 TaxID=3155665 RepID=UPI00342BA1D7